MKIMYFFIALALGLLIFGCLTTGSIDWDIKGIPHESFEVQND